MTPKQREALETVLGYLDAYECGLCGGSEPGQHTEGCPVLELRAMVTTPQTLYSQFVILVKLLVDKILQKAYTCPYQHKQTTKEIDNDKQSTKHQNCYSNQN